MLVPRVVFNTPSFGPLVAGKSGRKILVSVIFSARNSGPEMAAPIFMGAWKNAFFLHQKAMSIKFLVLGGGVFWGFGGGGRECRFFLMGAGIFLIIVFSDPPHA